MTYGVGTHSFLNSTEHRQMKKARAEYTKAYESVPHAEVIVGPICNCLSFRNPHELSVHKKLRSDYDWRPAEQREAQDYFYQEWR